jgi:hypothetical protein
MSRDLDIDDAVAHHPEAKAELAEMRDEIERLNMMLGVGAEAIAKVDNLHAEIERLRSHIVAMRVAALVDDWHTFDAEHDAALGRKGGA